jgi:hypothetical protein
LGEHLKNNNKKGKYKETFHANKKTGKNKKTQSPKLIVA